MGRLGKVASPAHSGNANPRLMRHKLADTTFRSCPNTDSSQTASPPVGAAACGSGADSPAPRSPAAGPAPVPGAFGPGPATGPGRISGYTSVKARQSASHINVKRERRAPGCARAQRASLQAGPPGKPSGPPARAGPPGRLTGPQHGTAHPRDGFAGEASHRPHPAARPRRPPRARDRFARAASHQPAPPGRPPEAPAAGPDRFARAASHQPAPPGRPPEAPAAGPGPFRPSGFTPAGATRPPARGARRGPGTVSPPAASSRSGSKPAQGRGDSRGGGTGIGGAGDGPPDHQQVGAGPQRLLGGGRPGLVVG